MADAYDSEVVHKFIQEHRIDAKRAHRMGMRYLELEVDVHMFVDFAVLKAQKGTLNILGRSFVPVGYSSIKHPLEANYNSRTIYLGEVREVNTIAEFTPTTRTSLG